MSEEPIDPDVDVASQGHEISQTHGLILLVISLGGGIGAVMRWGLGEVIAGSEFPWATFITNVSGSFALGIVMVLITSRWPQQRFIRPFFGVGLLGGFTTFSTYTEQTVDFLNRGEVLVAIVYVLTTLIAALMAVWFAVWLAWRVVR